MTETEVIMTWGGRETAAGMTAALPRRAKVEIVPPSSMHHALFRDAGVANPEEVNIAGGVELIATLATLDGLEAMAGLAGPLSQAGYRLHLHSPSPTLLLIPPQMG